MLRFVRFTMAAIAAIALQPLAAQNAGERERIEWAVERGRLLFGIDRAAWVATDDMRTRVPVAEQEAMRGYIVETGADGLLVTFYGGPKDAPVVHYRARVGAGGVTASEVFPSGRRPPLTPEQRRLAAARDAASRLSWSVCDRAAPNVAVIPPDTPEGPIDFYVMTPQMRTGEIPLGGHNRATLQPDGRVTDRRAFTKACIPSRLAGPEGDSVAISVSHLLDPVPTEIHVFSAMAAGMPVYVATDGPRIWQVTGEMIALVADDAADR